MKIPSLIALCSLGILTSSPAVDVFSYEDGVDFMKEHKVQLSGGMTASVSADEAVHGKHSLHLKWTEEGGSITIPSDIHTDNQIVNQRKHAAVFTTWIYQPKELKEQKLYFSFCKEGDAVPYFTFEYKLGHKGWRTMFYPFNRMTTIEKHEGNLDEMRVTAPPGQAGEAYLDLTVPSVQYDRRHASDDESYQFAKDDEHSRNRKGPPIDLYHQGYREIPDSPITAEQVKSIKDLEASVQKTLVGSKKKLNLGVLTENFKAYAIVDDGVSITGNHIYFLHSTDIYKPHPIHKEIKQQLKIDLKATGKFLLKLTQDWYHAEGVDKAKLEKMIISLHKLLLKSGWNKGHGQGTMHHFGYNSREYYRACFIGRELLEKNKLREPVAATLQWLNDSLYCYSEGAAEHYANLDYYNTLALPQLLAILMTESDSQRYHATQQWTKMLSESIATQSHNIDGGFKEDGSAYHHWGHYPAYQVGAMSSIGNLFYRFHDTPFRLSVAAHKSFEKSLLSMRIWSNKYNFPRSLSGRHPYPGDQKFGLHALKSAYVEFALSGTTESKSKINQKVAAAALRLYPDQAFKLPNSSAEKAPNGHWSYPYAATSAHRRGEWLAVARGHSKNVWASEIYGAVNLYGRYQSHGTLEILPEGGLTGSGVNEMGWDWARPPGSTVTYLSTEQIPFESVIMMLTSDTTFAATVHSDNRNGLFALQLAEIPEPNRNDIGLRARKSYSFFDNVIVCLGSDIHGPSPDHPVQTNLFQQFLKTQATPIAINSREVTSFPWVGMVKSTTLLRDTVGHYYYVPQGEKVQNLNLTRKTQHSRYHYPSIGKQPKSEVNGDQNPKTQGNYAAAWIDHGVQPKGAGYEYAVLVLPSADQVKGWKPNYQIIQHDADAHIVKSGDTECFSLFTGKGIKHSLISKVSKPCALITKQEGENLKISLTDPEMRFPGGNGGTLKGEIHLKPSDVPEEAKLSIVLKGKYASSSSGIALEHVADTTKLTFTTKRGRTLQCLLTPITP